MDLEGIILVPDEVAEALGIEPSTVVTNCRLKIFPGYLFNNSRKLGYRIPADALLAKLESEGWVEQVRRLKAWLEINKIPA